MNCLVSLVLLLVSERIFSGFEVVAGELKNDELIAIEFPTGENAVLRCDSLDENHNFHYWYHPDTNDIIGPNAEHFNKFKYEYEVLSGNLTIRNIDKQDAGLYDCASRGVRTDSIRISSIKVVVIADEKEAEAEVNSLKIILAICSLILFCSFIYAAYSVWKDRYTYPRYIEQFDNDDDVEENGEEIYRAPSTSGIIKQSIVKEKPKDYERPLISTDFESILDSRI